MFFIKWWDRERERHSISPPTSVCSSSLVFSTQWHFLLGHPRSQSAEKGGCIDCSCSAGLCLVSLTLSKADHTIPSTPSAGQERDPFTIHLPYRLSTYTATCTFLAWTANVLLLLLLRLCCVIVDAFSSEMKSTWMNGCVCSRANRKLRFCKHHSSRLFHRLLGNQSVDSILRLWQ